jgi:putative pyruvate formate lyase activating enzyme
VLRLLDGIVDVYLPDLKYADSDAGFQYSKVRDYKEHRSGRDNRDAPADGG